MTPAIETANNGRLTSIARTPGRSNQSSNNKRATTTITTITTTATHLHGVGEPQPVAELADLGEEVGLEGPLRRRLLDGHALQPLQLRGELPVAPALDERVHAGLGGKEGAFRGACGTMQQTQPFWSSKRAGGGAGNTRRGLMKVRASSAQGGGGAGLQKVGEGYQARAGLSQRWQCWTASDRVTSV